ncbi:hypothetical protein INT47_003101 [Mucor saturninus]|uniref:Uncharacterized protein n=1 Tax=Mucor saturninus TaxID=64648 RepID=A0A8H7QRM2_9FUNG|nr:hypothetical protein INT47_003101 [Mucor saturninus]
MEIYYNDHLVKYKPRNGMERNALNVYRHIIEQHLFRSFMLTQAFVDSCSEQSLSIKFWPYLFECFFGGNQDVFLQWDKTKAADCTRSLLNGLSQLQQTRIQGALNPGDYDRILGGYIQVKEEAEDRILDSVVDLFLANSAVATSCYSCSMPTVILKSSLKSSASAVQSTDIARLIKRLIVDMTGLCGSHQIGMIGSYVKAFITNYLDAFGGDNPSNDNIAKITIPWSKRTHKTSYAHMVNLGLWFDINHKTTLNEISLTFTKWNSKYSGPSNPFSLARTTICVLKSQTSAVKLTLQDQPLVLVLDLGKAVRNGRENTQACLRHKMPPQRCAEDHALLTCHIKALSLTDKGDLFVDIKEYHKDYSEDSSSKMDSLLKGKKKNCLNVEDWISEVVCDDNVGHDN